MAVNVNPPPQLRVPQAFTKDREVFDYFQQLQTIIFQLRQRTGGDNDGVFPVNDLKNQVGENFNSFVQQLFKESQGLPEFTIDTTGFTTDTTLITVDKVIA